MKKDWRYCVVCGKRDIVGATGAFAFVFVRPGLCRECAKLSVRDVRYDPITGMLVERDRFSGAAIIDKFG
jgi:hypothetical protein